MEEGFRCRLGAPDAERGAGVGDASKEDAKDEEGGSGLVNDTGDANLCNTA